MANTTIQLGTTVYGADINWDTGVVEVTHGIYDFGDLLWVRDNSGTFYAVAPLKKAASLDVISSCYQHLTVPFRFVEYDSYPDGCIGGNDGATNNYVFVKDTEYTDATAFKTARTGQTICYELATPTTLQLTPTQLELLKGYNRVTIEAGEIELGYIAKLT